MITYQFCTNYSWTEESSSFVATLTLTLICDDKGNIETELQSAETLFHEFLTSTWGERNGATRFSKIELFHTNIEDLKLLATERVLQARRRIEEIVLLNRGNKELCENTENRETYFI